MTFSIAVNGKLRVVRCVRVDHGFEWKMLGEKKASHAELHLIGVSKDAAIDIKVYNGQNSVAHIRFAELKALIEQMRKSRRQATIGNFSLNLSCEKCEFDRVAINLQNPDTHIHIAGVAVALAKGREGE